MPPRSGDSIPAVADSVAGLTVFVRDPAIHFSLGWTPDDVQALREALEQALGDARLKVVAPGAPHALTATVNTEWVEERGNSFVLHLTSASGDVETTRYFHVGKCERLGLGGPAEEHFDRSLVASPLIAQAARKKEAIAPASSACDPTMNRVIATGLVKPLARSEALLAYAASLLNERSVVQTPATRPAPAPPATPTPAAAGDSPRGAAPFVAAAPQPTACAVVIGIEKYSQGLPPPTGARADAQRFADLARASLGVARDHVQLVTDEQATKGGIERAIAWAQASAPAGGRIYFYFSGHGAPDASAGTPYIVPSDGDPKFLQATGVAMKDVLAKLGASKAREVLAIVDSCFSGAGGRSVLPPGARPLVRVKEESAPAQLALFSASSGSEISGPAPEGGGGLFTKFVIDGLGTGAADINGDGQVSLGELSQWVGPRVAREAKKDNRDQNPSLTVGKGIGSADGLIVEWGLPTK